MKQYWDYTEKERSEMTEDQVKSFLDLHLMSKGILKVTVPTLLKIEDEPVLAKVAMFEAGDCIFDTAEQAQAFLALNPKKSSYDYNVGYDLRYPMPIDPEIKQVMMINHQDLLDHSSTLKKNKTSREANEKASSKYSKDSEAMEKCMEEIWNDFRSQQEMSRKHKKITDTWFEYFKLADNNEEMALGFLKKAFDQESIEEAFNWFEMTLPKLTELKKEDEDGSQSV